MKDTRYQYSSPDEVIFGPDFHQSLYCHLLCGLICLNEVQFVFPTFAHSIVDAFRTFKKGIMTGSMEPHLKKLRHYAGNLPLMSAGYGSSEGWIGANIDPELPPELANFAVLSNIGYFEFIPLRDKAEVMGMEKIASSCQYEELEPVGLTEVEAGEEYEIVITNFAGLYRYRLGDVVRVAGFHNSTPKLQFVCRRSLLLSVNIDKNTEKDLQIAVEEASKLLAAEKLEVIDFSSYADMSTEPGHYVIFWELSGTAKEEVLSSCCDCLDRAFVDPGYVGQRKVKAIGPLELRILREGTFQQILNHYLSLGAAVSQFKTPRCIGQANSKVLQILCMLWRIILVLLMIINMQ